MRLPKVLELFLCSVAVTAFGSACSETPYVFFDGGGVCDGGFCVGEDPREEAGESGPPAQPGEKCESSRDPSVTLERLELGTSGRCVSQGPYSPLRGESSYAIALVPCAESLSQLWALGVLEGGSLELRNAAVDLNLDVRFAASDDGTPIVLFTPHQFYNQRFNMVGGPQGFNLIPLHAPMKCLTESEGTLVLLSCEAGSESQTFRRIACR